MSIFAPELQERKYQVVDRDVIILPSGRAMSLKRVFPSEILTEQDALALVDALFNRGIGLEAAVAMQPGASHAGQSAWRQRMRVAIFSTEANLKAAQQRLEDIRGAAYDRRFVKLAKAELPAEVIERMEEILRVASS